MEILRQGEEIYWIYDHPGRLTAEQAIALIEAEFDIKFPRGDYKYMIKTMQIGDECSVDVTITRKRDL